MDKDRVAIDIDHLVRISQKKKEAPSSDHYKALAIEPITYIEANQLGFHAGNVIKYVSRYQHKNGLEDLKKARWYIDRLIENEEGKNKEGRNE